MKNCKFLKYKLVFQVLGNKNSEKSLHTAYISVKNAQLQK